MNAVGFLDRFVALKLNGIPVYWYMLALVGLCIFFILIRSRIRRRHLMNATNLAGVKKGGLHSECLYGGPFRMNNRWATKKEILNVCDSENEYGF